MSYSDRFAACYLRPNQAERVARLLREVPASTGLSLLVPGKAVVAIITEEGEQHFVSIDAFTQRLNNQADLRFQYWWTNTDDLYCRRLHEDRLISLHFGCDGCSESQVDRVWEWLRQTFLPLIETSDALLLVLDRDGRTAECPWREIVLGEIEVSIPYPDEFVVPATSHCVASVNAAFAQTFQLTPHAVAIRSVT